MSIICVQKTKEKITFASDSQSIYYGQAYEDTNKLYEIRNIVIGFVGKPGNRNKLYAFLEDTIKKEIYFSKITDLIKLVRDSQIVFDDNDNLLISDSKKVFNIHPLSGDCLKVDTFEAIGSGANYAIGAFYAGASIKKSVKIACEIDVNCGEPIKVVEVRVKER